MGYGGERGEKERGGTGERTGGEKRGDTEDADGTRENFFVA